MIADLQSSIRNSGPFREILAQLGEFAVSVQGLAGSLDALLLGELRRESGAQMLVVARDRETAERLRDDLSLAVGPTNVRYLPGAVRQGDTTQDVSDIEALRSLLEGEATVVVTHPRALIQALPKPGSLTGKTLTLSRGAEAGLTTTIEQLGTLGFQRTDFVQTHGEYAVRGGIVDVFPYVGENPLRIEFSGDTVESVREFDPIAQRSIRELDSAVVVPDLLHGSDVSAPVGSLPDYLSSDAIVILDEPELVRAGLEETARHGGEGLLTPPRVLEELGLFRRLDLTGFRSDGRRVDFGASGQPSFNGSITLARRTFREMQDSGFRVIIGCDTQGELARLKELLGTLPQDEGAEQLPNLDHLEFTLETPHRGFVLPSLRVAVFTEHQIFNRLKRHGRARRPRFRGFSRQDVQLLRRGDYVVHQDYGIGRFDGLQRIRVRSVEQEVVRVLYEEDDVLYVNLNYVTKLQKYSSREGHVPRLTKLGSPDWERLKARTKRRVKEIARDLISLYAKRKSLAGVAFPPDTPWQKELEASFMFEDTIDQARATIEVKRDMEEAFPMDRLICGDVGFGKTEVAVRAAFKCVMAGRQAAVLVPTTILAMQHYNTFLDRVSRYGVTVQAISRFKSRKDQMGILEALAAGRVDILIGTHRLLSKDVRFKDLGLLVIDEEHRFGVAAKEKLRQLRTQVDTLAMTATPIPRTLHFSLMGARDLSIIATPPRNRLPILTELTHWNDELIHDAVMHELRRGGQVYVVHDRIQNIEEISARLQKLLPGVRVRHAHGQMHAHELEETMLAFLEKSVDVLVATKIIESGLDIPNVNTILINRADRFGMAELYQLRGRVGRSNQQAFAYLLTPPVSLLPRATVQRLQAMQEFTELGSGFNLAMRDLEIRGAGNLLGAEQSGYIDTMGFETYTRILEEAVQELKEEEFSDLFAGETAAHRRSLSTVVEPEFEALIPQEYIQNDVERLGMYRRLYALETSAQLEEINQELLDRFGKLPQQAENLFGVVRLRLEAARLGMTRVRIAQNSLDLEFPPESNEEFYGGEAFQHIMNVISHMRADGASLRQNGSVLTLHMPLKSAKNEQESILAALSVLARLKPPSEQRA